MGTRSVGAAVACLVLSAVVVSASPLYIHEDDVTGLEAFQRSMKALEDKGYRFHGLERVHNPPESIHHLVRNHDQLEVIKKKGRDVFLEEQEMEEGVSDPSFLKKNTLFRDSDKHSFSDSLPAFEDSHSRTAKGERVLTAGKALRELGYTVVKFLGAGSFGAVAKVSRDGEMVAVKFNISPDLESAEELGEECEYMMTIKKQMAGQVNLTPVMYAHSMESATVRGGPGGRTFYYGYCFMPTMSGDLEHWIINEVNPNPANTYKLARELARQLLYGVWWIHHTMGDIHTDLKSPNVFYEEIDAPPYVLLRIADFGKTFMIKKNTNMCKSNSYPLWLTSLGYQAQSVLSALLTKAESTRQGSALYIRGMPTVCVPEDRAEKQPLWAIAMMVKEMVCGTVDRNRVDLPFLIHARDPWLYRAQNAYFEVQENFLELLFGDLPESMEKEDFLFHRFMQKMMNPCPGIASQTDGIMHNKDCTYRGEDHPHMQRQQQYTRVKTAMSDEWLSHYRGDVNIPSRAPLVCTIGRTDGRVRARHDAEAASGLDTDGNGNVRGDIGSAEKLFAG